MSANASQAQAQPSVAASAKEDGGARDRKRLEIRKLNLDAWQHGPQAPSGSLDSNLKKNTAFIKRVRQSLALDSRDQLLKEVQTLSLEKYLEEIVQAVPDGLAKCASVKDCWSAVEVLSALHVRFGGAAFSAPLTVLLTSLLAPSPRGAAPAVSQEQKERDESARVVRHRTLLRVAADLAIVETIGRDAAGVGKEAAGQGPEWLYGVIRDLLSSDREHVNVPIVLGLLKATGPTLITPSSNTEAASADQEKNAAAASESAGVRENNSESTLLSAEIRAKFRKLFETYFATLSKRIVKEHSRLQEQDKRNHEAYIRSGEIFEDRQQNYEKMTKNFEKLLEWGKVYADLIGVPMPTLTDTTKASNTGLAINVDARSSLLGERSEEEFASGRSPWEDEDSRRFYEELIDLRDMVPMSLLTAGQSGATKAGTSTEAESGEKNAKEESKAEDAGASPSAKPEDLPESPNLTAVPEPAEEQLNAGPAAQLNALLARLPEMSNRAMIDSAAVEFAFLNSKAARRKLVKQIGAVPRNRLDLIPYYSRLIATLNKYMPDVGSGMIAVLDEEFRYLQRKRNVDLAETRSKNTRFIGELTKFRVTPTHTVFHCFKVCLDDFTGANVDNLATLLETCGRFLLRTDETGDRMRSMLEMLRRKRAAQNLDHRQLLMLDNAYYQCNPPERKAIEHKVRSPMEQYIRHLIYDVLTKRTVEKVLKLLRKLHWEDPEVVGILRGAFTKVWRLKFSNIHLLAILLHDLQPYHSDFVVAIIDQIFENIRLGMEQNIFKHNQRRVASVKYLGELYNYRLVNSSVIFDQLWSFTTFGHPEGRPLPNQVSPIDAPDDFFRVRLLCTLLDTCGMCFDRGSLKKRLDEYLIFLNMYVLCKEPMPMEIDFMLSDTIEALRPKLVLKRTFEEAATAVDEMMASHRGAAHDAVEDDGDDSDGSDEFTAEEHSGPRQSRGEEEDSSSGDDDSGADVSDRGYDEDDDAVVLRREEQSVIDQEADDEFARELAKMMADSGGEVRKKGGSNLFDAGIPFIKRATQQDNVVSEEETEVDGQHMRFSLLSKKGNKHRTHDVHVPVDAAIAVNTRTKQLRDKAERQQLKELVLSYEGRDEQDERRSLETTLGRRGIRLRFADEKGG